MTLASALVRTPAGFGTDFVDPNAPTTLSSALLGLHAPAPRQMIVQQAPDQPQPSASTGNSAPSAAGSGQVPTDMLAQALMKNAMPTGPMYSPLEPLGRLAELWAGNRGEQRYLQERQKAVADFGNSFGGDPITAGLNSPLPEIQDQALKMKMSMAYPIMGTPNPISGYVPVTQGGQYKGSYDPGGGWHPAGAGMGAGGGGAVPAAGDGAPSGGASASAPPVAAGGGGAAPTVNGGAAPAPSSNGSATAQNAGSFGDWMNPWDIPETKLKAAMPFRAELQGLQSTQTFNVIRDSRNSFYSALPQAGADVNPTQAAALVASFSKAINPYSTIKYGQAIGPDNLTGSFLDDFGAVINKALTGGGQIPQPLIDQMRATVDNTYAATAKTQKAIEAQYADVERHLGVQPGTIVTSSDVGSQPTPPAKNAPIPIDQAVPQLKSAVAAGGPDAQAAMTEFDQAYGQGAAQQALQSSMAQAPATRRPTLGAMVPQLPPATNPMRAYPPGAP